MHTVIRDLKIMARNSVTVLVVAASLCSLTINVVYANESKFVNCSDSQVDALMDFKNGLNDPDHLLSSWRISNSCCQWLGIGCDVSTGAVISVDLHNPYAEISIESNNRYEFWNLSGEISPSLLKLESLAYLDLSYNLFDDIPIPAFVGSLSNLQYLNLSKAGFSGKIPPELGNLSSLQVLDVTSGFSSLSVDDFQWVVGLKSLKNLGMNGVDLSLVGVSWFSVLQTLPFLAELHLSSCGLSGSLSSLKLVNFTKLAVVDLSFNTFSSTFPDWVANISNVVRVDLSHCGLYGRIPLGLSELPSLKYLDLSMNYNLSASCHEFFGGTWKKIEVLHFSSNKLHGKLPNSIGNTTFLSVFDLSGNNVSGGIPNSIGGLCNLVYFDLSGNNLNGYLPDVLEGTLSCASKSPLPSLVSLRLSNNKLVGELPDWLGHIPNLVELGLEYNLLEGHIPASLGGLGNLTDLGLGGNELNGTLPETIGLLSELIILDVSSNRLTGNVTESHFTKLSKLRFLRLSSNSLALDVGLNWIPPFQVVNFGLGSCNLGPAFPFWLKSQRMAKSLDISNATISGFIPKWFWDMTFNLSLLNVSQNQLEGQIPSPFFVAPFADIDLSYNHFEGPVPLPSVEIELFELSNNRFSGPIPKNISQSMPNLIYFSLSNNKLNGEVPESIGEMQLLQVIDLSRNYLTGRIPLSIQNCSYLKALDLAYNNISGILPSYLGRLTQLQSLHLNNNFFFGELPLSFKNLSSLQTLDLGENRLSGTIPLWLGDGFSNLRIIKLRSNAFHGIIPAELSSLSSLQVLDLADNKLTGNIPGSFGDFKAMAQEKNINKYLFYGFYRGSYYEESLVVNVKGLAQKYTKTLSLVTSIDLSGNNLSGDFPREITKLHGLMVLNFSGNQIIGLIPESISDIRQLSSLDISNNNLSGVIPSSMSSLTFLSYLNVSNNNFSGRIPYTGQMTTFRDSTFSGNPGLCGAPLVVKCISDDNGPNQEHTDEANEGEEFIDKWFFLSLGLGFAFGILVPFLVLAIRKQWSEAYFSIVDKVVNVLLGVSKTNKSKNKHCRGIFDK